MMVIMPKILSTIVSWRMLIVFSMGFSSGLPLLLIGSTLKAWFTESGMDLTTIGFFSLVGLPYTLKFAWSPLLDRFVPPFLGRRRGWLLINQAGLIAALLGLSLTNPSQQTAAVAALAFLIALFSATQDIAIDAYRREILETEELGLGSSLAVNGYRIAMLFAGAFALYLADHVPWNLVYTIMAAGMGIGVLTTLLAPEPKVDQAPPRNMKEAFIEPFVEYFSRPGAWTILAFIVLYKVGDSMASEMTMPFYLQMGFTKTQIGAVAKFFGFWATIIGSLTGGLLILKLNIHRSLWIFGFLQALSTLGFALLTHTGPNVSWLAAVIAFENLCGGMGTSAYAAFMGSLTNRRFTATQYALLSSLMGIPRVIAAAPTGWMAENMGWEAFFVLCTLAAIPGLLLLFKIAPLKSLPPHPIQSDAESPTAVGS